MILNILKRKNPESCTKSNSRNLFLKLLLIFLCMGSATRSFSQLLTVVDVQTGEALEMATIMSTKPALYAVTNARGQADISEFRNSARIEIRMLGYKTEQMAFSEIEKKSFRIAMQPSAINFDEVVVSATRWSQVSKNIPAKIAVFSPREMALQNPQTAADLLGATGEVFIQKSQQGGGSPMIRGFATNRLLYTVDGVRMNSAIFRAGNIQNVISIDPFSIESTEVFFGPGSVIYGSDAIGGVMSFQTLTPQLSLTDKPLITAKAVMRYSSASNETTGHFELKTGWKKWASVTGITFSKYGDLKMGKYGPDEYLKKFYVLRMDNTDHSVENPDPMLQTPGAYSQINLMEKVRFSPNNHWDFQYGFHYSETSEYSRYDRLMETQNSGLPAYAVWNYGPQVWMMNNLSATHKAQNPLYDRMTLRLAQQYFQESRIDRKFNHHRLRTQLEEVQAYSANLDFEKVQQKHKFSYGLEYVMNDVNSEGSATDIRDGSVIAVPDRYPASKWSSGAGYLNYQYSASDRFLLQGGVRYNFYKVVSDFTRHLSFYPFGFSTSTIQNDAVTGSFGLVYRPDESWKITASAGTGFRAPNVDDIGKIFDFVSGEVIVPNTALKSEYAWNAELGISKIVAEVLKLDVTGFYTFLDNAMVRREFKVNGADSIMYNGEMSRVYAIQNAAYGIVYGFSAGFELKLPEGFSLSSRYNYQTGTEEMDNGTVSSSRHAAPAFGLTRFSYQREKLQLQLYANYSAEVSFANLNEEERQKPVIYARDTNGNPYSPAWYTLNFKAKYQFNPALAVSAGVENITDQRYRPYSSGLVAAGRNFIVSLRAGL